LSSGVYICELKISGDVLSAKEPITKKIKMVLAKRVKLKVLF
jgi:hypothetical protein